MDELWLLIHPLTLGSPSKKLFADGTIPAAFTLLESTATPSGVSPPTTNEREKFGRE